jgi:hypothetical protein
VLRPRGGVAILRMIALLERPWAREFGEILMAGRPEHPAFGERGAAAAHEDDPAFGPVRERSVTTPVMLDREQVLAWVASFSWVAVLVPAERERLLERLGELLARHDVSREEYDVLHQIWLARLL